MTPLGGEFHIYEKLNRKDKEYVQEILYAD